MFRLSVQLCLGALLVLALGLPLSAQETSADDPPASADRAGDGEGAVDPSADAQMAPGDSDAPADTDSPAETDECAPDDVVCAEAVLAREAAQEPDRETPGNAIVEAAEDPRDPRAVISPLHAPDETEDASQPREELINEVLGLDRDRDLAQRWDIASHSDGKHWLEWGEGWGHFGLADYIVLGVSLAGTVGAQVVGPLRRDETAWTGQTRFDETVRRVLRRGEDRERERMKDVSDILLSLTVSWPFLFDGLMSALWYHDEPEIGRELALMAVEVQFISATIQSLANFSSRERPYGDICGAPGAQPDDALPEDDGACTGSVRHRSFFSGHTSQSFAAAATVCMFHARLPLYGGGSPDALACGMGMALATTVGAFRIMADVHHITDVITGAAVGTAVGIALPALRMRNWGRRNERHISVVPNGVGLAVVGNLR